jgi:hypothetical protein
MPYGIYKIFVECDLIGGKFQENIETSEAKFFSIENLPPLSIERNTKEQIEMCFNTKAEEFHEAIFD